jgi:hypothetical protein
MDAPQLIHQLGQVESVGDKAQDNPNQNMGEGLSVMCAANSLACKSQAAINCHVFYMDIKS